MSQFFSAKYLKYRDALRGDEIVADKPCAYCGYNLRGLRFGGACPECGVPIVVASDARDSLSDAALDDIRRLRNGFWLAMVCVPLVVLAPMGAALTTGTVLAVNAAMLGVGLAWVVAVFLMTPSLQTPGAVRRGFSTRSRLRRAARWLQLGWPAAQGLFLVGTTSAQIGAVMCMTAGTVGMVLLSLLLIGLAEWCYNDFAQRQLNWTVWGMSAAVVGLCLSFLAIFKVFLCLFSGWWLLAWFTFMVALVSLGKSVTWSAVHARERAMRDKRLREKARS